MDMMDKGLESLSGLKKFLEKSIVLGDLHSVEKTRTCSCDVSDDRSIGLN